MTSSEALGLRSSFLETSAVGPPRRGSSSRPTPARLVGSTHFCVASALMIVACFSPSARRIAAWRPASAGFTDGGLQLLLLAQRLLLLDQHLLGLADLVDARFLLGDLLLGDGGGERPGLLGLGLLALDGGAELRLPRLLVAQRLRDGHVGLVPLGLPFLIGVRRLDHRVALRQRLADDGIALHLGRPLLAEGVEVALFVADLLDGAECRC